MSQSGFSIKLSNVHFEEVAFNEPSSDFISTFNDANLKTGLGINFALDAEKDLIIILLQISYDYIDNVQPTLTLLDFKGSFEFHISNLKESVALEGDNYKIPENVMERLTDVAISSARGIIIAKTAESFINKIYVPIFDVKMILEDMKRQG